MDRSTAVLITLVVYKIVLVGIGVLASRLSRSEEDFFLGGKKLGPLVSAISASASSSSAWTLLSVSGMAYSQGLAALWLFPACVGGFALNWFVVAPALRRHIEGRPAITMIDVIAGGAGRWAAPVATYASVIIAALFTVYVASQFKAAGLTFAEIFDIELYEATLIGAAIVIFYTLLGGFWAVSLTDTLQGLLMAATAVILPLVAFFHVGPGEFAAGLQAVADEDFLDPTHGRTLIAGFGFVLGLFGIGLAYPGQPHVVNRFMALKKGARSLGRARLYAMTWAVLIYAGMILLGLCGRILHPVLGNDEKILIRVANESLPPVIGGVMIAAILSAIMSTADSQLLVVASSLTHDLRRGRKAPIDIVRRSRLAILGTGLVAVLVVNTWDESIFNSVLFAFSAMGSAFGPLLLATILRGPVGPHRSMAAITVGLGGTILARFGFEIPPDHQVFCEYFLPFLAASAIVFGKRRG